MNLDLGGITLMNDAVEIIGGEGIELAFKDLNINAKHIQK